MNRIQRTTLLMGMVVILAWELVPGMAEAARKNRKQAEQFRVSPWRVWGTTGFSYNRTMAQGAKPSASTNTMTTVGGDKSMSGYLWKPWMVRWGSTMSAGFSTSKNSPDLHEDNAMASSTSMLSRNGSGNVNLALFPVSRFPVSMVYTYTVTDSSEGEENGPATRNTNLSLGQSFRSETGGLWNGSVGYDRKINVSGSRPASGIGILPDLKREETRNISDSYRATMSVNLPDQTIGYNSNYDRNEVKSTEQLYTTRNTSMVVNHDYRHSVYTSMSNIANYGINRVNTEENGSTGATPGLGNSNARSAWRQYSNTLSWRSEKEPLNMVSSTRVMRNDMNVSASDFTGGKQWNGDQTTFSTLNTNYQINSILSLGASLSGTYSIQHDEEAYDAQKSSSQSLILGLSPEQVVMGEYTYAWNASASSTNTASDNARQQLGSSESISHTVSRNIKLTDETYFNYGLSEGGSTSNAHHKKPDFSANHAVSTLLSNTAPTSASTVNLSLSEMRNFVTAHDRNYTTTLQFSRSNSMSETESLSGNMSMQWTWNRSETAETTEDTSSSFDVNYQNREFFNMPQLRFSTRLGINNEGLVPLIKDGQREGYSFSNRLEYQIGMLTVGMTCDMQENITRIVGPGAALPTGSVVEGLQEQAISADRSAVYMIDVRRYFNQVF